jgi:hypothetical protein
MEGAWRYPKKNRFASSREKDVVCVYKCVCMSPRWKVEEGREAEIREMWLDPNISPRTSED